MRSQLPHGLRTAGFRALLVAPVLLASPPATHAVVINEVLASHSGTDDTEFVEFFGAPASSLDGLSLLVVEGDAFDPGRIDRRVDFGPTDVIGGNGFYLVGNPTGLLANYGIVPDDVASIAANFFENSSLTVALVETSSLGGGVGSLVSGAETVLDAVALTDGDAGDTFFFGAPVIGPDGPFFPAGARRLVDGLDTDTAADWVIADFVLPGENTPTPGTLAGVPEPSTLAILGLGLAGLAAAGRRRHGRSMPASSSSAARLGGAITTTP